MDFDDIDDLETPFLDSVAQAREEILKGIPAAEQWTVLAERHDFFKDMIKEAKTSGHSIGPILVAAAGVTHAIQDHTVDNTDAAVCSAEEARVLVSLADTYDALFSASPIPSACAWSDMMKRTFSSPAVSLTGDLACALHDCAQSSGASFLSPIADLVRDGKETVRLDDDDGSFTVNAFKAFLRRCVQLGRKCTRGETSATHVKEMLSTISSYLTQSTLEW